MREDVQRESAASASSDDVVVVVSIDTEEDNWGPARDGITIDNIRQLPKLNRFLTSLGVRPTYFAAYQVLGEDWARDIIRELHRSTSAEIGAHLHPWNTPPLAEELSWQNTMGNNLSSELQREKLRTLTDRLTQVLASSPKAFRAGRFGLGRAMIALLSELEYEADSSVTPYIDWRDIKGNDYRDAPDQPYRLIPADGDSGTAETGGVVELPVSSGYSRRPFRFWKHVHAVLDQPILRRLRMPGVARRLNVISKITLSPETDSVDDMLVLSRNLIARGARHLMVFFHSPSLVPGLSPFVRTEADVEGLYGSLGKFVEGVERLGNVRFLTASEAARAWAEDHNRALLQTPAT